MRVHTVLTVLSCGMYRAVSGMLYIALLGMFCMLLPYVCVCVLRRLLAASVRIFSDVSRPGLNGLRELPEVTPLSPLPPWPHHTLHFSNPVDICLHSCTATTLLDASGSWLSTKASVRLSLWSWLCCLAAPAVTFAKKL